MISARRFLAVFAAALLSLAACSDDVVRPPLEGAGAIESRSPVGPRADWEVWALDQGPGLNRIHVYGSDLEERARIDFPALWEAEEIEQEVLTPHMIGFSSNYDYAAVASTQSGNVTIIRTSDYQVVDIITTGPGAHMAHFTPDDQSIWVANIGTVTFTEITADLETESFAIGRELDLVSDAAWAHEFSDLQGGGGGARGLNVPAPVCHEYTEDGHFAYVTLGPGAGGLVVVDIQASEPTVVKAFPRDEVRANCGLARSPDGRKIFANWGDPGDPADPPAQSGAWYVFDTSDHSLVLASEETRGIDAHGTRHSPVGPWLWQVNRGTSNGILINSRSHRVVHEIDFVGDSPDILDFSPDGRLAFVSLRGPNPVTGAAHVATGSTPGFAVINTAQRRKVRLIQPAELEELESSDFHGLGVRVIP